MISRLALALTLLLAGSTVNAQDAAPEVESGERSGFMIGFSLGAGFSTIYRPSFSGYVGGMATPKIGVVVEGYVVGREDDEAHSMIAAGVQYFVRDRVWIKGAIGFGDSSRDDFDFAGDFEEAGGRLGVLGGAGFEVVRSGRFTIDLQLRGVATTGGAGRSGSVNIGFNWY